MSDVPTPAPEPDDALADLTDEEQVALLQAQPNGGQTDNRLSDGDEDIEQPPQDPTWVPPASS